MLSIFVIYSLDRLKQFEIFYECLKEMPGYEKCQKILVVDGESSNVTPPDFEIVYCKRPNKYLNLASAWDLGVKHSIHDKIWCLNPDRILPTYYLESLGKEIEDNCFVFSSQIVSVIENEDLQTIRKYREDPYLHWVQYEQDYRIPHPPNMEFVSMGKNPMSGNTGFTKKTFIKSGGLDYNLEGPKLADTDYYYKTYINKYKFKTIQCLELRLKHEYNPENLMYKYMYVYNALKICEKYNLKPNFKILEKINSNKMNLSFSNCNLDKFIELCQINNLKII